MKAIASRALGAIDGLQRTAFALASASVAVLLGLMLLEVFRRYVLGSPSIWSYEAVGIVNGAVFVLAAGYALQTGGHVAVDAATRFMPVRLRDALVGIFNVAGLAPVLAYVAQAGFARTLTAFARGEVDDVSPWRHVVWPHYGLFSVGLALFALAALAAGLRQLASARDG
jgi:TRAP-type C4-dicarboxylate transport system permease small subunit